LKILLIGYGSIGKRHEEVLLNISDTYSVDIVTKQHLKNKITFVSLSEVKQLDTYDYFVIASETVKHYEQLKYLDVNVQNKIILCEKPLFETNKNIEIINNKVYVGYVLRFHPLLNKIKSFMADEKVLSAHINCGSYLPSWRPNSDYTKLYSANKKQGGGVLLDLSHEIDYVQWLFGNLTEIKSYQAKISDLKIDSDDFTSLIAKTNTNVFVNISIDYISKITHRTMIINTIENTYSLDFIKNTLIKKNKKGVETILNADDLARNDMFDLMHKAIINETINPCTFNEALEIMDTITTIQEQNK
jgi:predicted dehydrogenase